MHDTPPVVEQYCWICGLAWVRIGGAVDGMQYAADSEKAGYAAVVDVADIAGFSAMSAEESEQFEVKSSQLRAS